MRRVRIAPNRGWSPQAGVLAWRKARRRGRAKQLAGMTGAEFDRDGAIFAMLKSVEITPSTPLARALWARRAGRN